MQQLELFENGPTFTRRDTKTVTFRGKLGLPFHRWYRLTPSFSPHLADDIAKHFGLGGNDYVLDPFSGVGTVPLCMSRRGVPSCSIEINPYLFFVGTVKTRSYKDVAAIAACFDAFKAAFQRALRELPAEKDAAAYLKAHAESIPRINHPQRWWSPGNLMQLVCVREVLSQFDALPHHLDLLKMGVLGILVPVSNAKHNHVSLTFADQPAAMVNMGDVLNLKYKHMMEDIKAASAMPHSAVTIYRGNSKEASKVLPEDVRVSAVITSPPYANRFSYARETRPHLFFFDFIDDAHAVGQLETDAIGGTWGKATSVLAAGVSPANALVESLLAPYTRNIDDAGSLMASYVIKYFNDMYVHASEISKVCADRCRLAYVIGNSRFYGHPLASDEILGGIFASFGFELERIDRMRRRQSKTGLYEAVVFMNRTSR